MAVDVQAIADATGQSGVSGLAMILPMIAARSIGYVAVHPIFGRFGITNGFVRGAVILAMTIPVLPTALAQFAAAPETFTITSMPFAVLREMSIGALLGLICGLPFWAAQAAGDFIDMQRGAAMANIVDPASSGEVSVTGTFLVLACLLVLTASGALMPALFGPLLESYRVFPPFTPLAESIEARGALVLGLLDQLLRAGVVLALPVLIPLLLLEFVIGLATKYMPAINGQFLAMSAKQFIHVLLLLVYTAALAAYAMGAVGTGPFGPEALRAFIEPGAR